MDRADFIEAFLDVADSELSKPANNILSFLWFFVFGVPFFFYYFLVSP
jgi:hypothetical protein